MAKKKQEVAYEVIVEFECKLTRQYFRVGSAYSGDADRVKQLTDAGYLGDAIEFATTDDPPLKEVDDNGPTDNDKKDTKAKPE